MRQIKFRAWDGQKMWAEVGEDRKYLNDYFRESEYTFMQFTGFHDKEGREIYEGDIVEGPHGARGLIETIQIFKWIFVIGEDDEKHVPIDMHHALIEMQGMDNCDVIGNIYESPELLNTD